MSGGPPAALRGSRDRLGQAVAAAARQGRGALSVYLPAGLPDVAGSADHLCACIEGGADWLEVGIPFSDPAADGPAIQAAGTLALRGGVTVAGALAVAAQVRRRHPEAPLVAMTYANLVHRAGWDAFAGRLREAGIDGLVVPDAPLEEAGPLASALAKANLAHVPLVAPTTPDARMAQAAAAATGFLYVVSSVGVTGQQGPGPLLRDTVRRAKAAAAPCGVPVVAGFGLRTAADVQAALAAGADGAIVGSAIVRRVMAGADPAGLRGAVAALRAGTKR